MNVKNFTYTELNEMFSMLIEEHRDDTEFFSAESAKEFANDELVNGEYLCVQNAFDKLATMIDGLKDVFSWSCGIDGNSYDVGLIHLKTSMFNNDTVRMDMIMAECQRRGIDVDSNSITEILRIANEMDCVRI